MPPGLRSAVFVDRDGVINEAIIREGKPYSPMRSEELHVIDGAAQACTQLQGAGYAVVVITNQPEIARGRLDTAELGRMHDSLRRQVPVDAIYYCPHDDRDGCDCRKPAPGLVHDASRDLDLDPTSSFLVGDRWRDIEAGRRAGCRTVLVGSGYGEKAVDPDVCVESLAEAAKWIIKQGRVER